MFWKKKKLHRHEFKSRFDLYTEYTHIEVFTCNTRKCYEVKVVTEDVGYRGFRDKVYEIDEIDKVLMDTIEKTIAKEKITQTEYEKDIAMRIGWKVIGAKINHFVDDDFCTHCGNKN